MTENQKIKSVGVIGVGSIGLCAIKWAVERGFDVVAFERNDECGGVWRQQKPPCHSAAYDSLITNSSRKIMELSDFKFPFKTSGYFPHHTEIKRYLEAYKDQFNLDKYIRWNTEVKSVRKIGNQWEIIAGDDSCTMVDAVMVSGGKLWKPKYPRWAKALPSSIEWMHSKDYRNPDLFRGKRVLIVGIGNSSLDIALELSKVDGIEVSVSCRRGTTIIPTKDDAGKPNDTKLGSRYYQELFPQSLRLFYIYRMVGNVNDEFRKAGLPEPPGGLFAPQSPTANLKESQQFIEQLRKHKIKFVAGYSGEVDNDHILLDDGTRMQVDSIIFATGFDLDMSDLLEPSIAREVQHVASWQGDDGITRDVPWLKLYKNIMYPKDPTLCFLGYITSFGNETCIGEMQARWATAMWSGIFPTPKLDQINNNLDANYKHFSSTKPSVSGYVRYVKYMDSLSKDIGCYPENISKYYGWSLNTLRILWGIYFGPVVPSQFRLVGQDMIKSKL